MIMIARLFFLHLMTLIPLPSQGMFFSERTFDKDHSSHDSISDPSSQSLSCLQNLHRKSKQSSTTMSNMAKSKYRSAQHTSCTPEAVLSFVQRNGWNSSVVEVTESQIHSTSCSMYQGNCHKHGENLLGTCFCLPGYTGRHCEHSIAATIKSTSSTDGRSLLGGTGEKYIRRSSSSSSSPPLCTNSDDRCFYTSQGGVWLVSYDRWHLAQVAESAAWKESSSTAAEAGDRVDEHMIDFDEYKLVGPVGSHLGVFLEIGAGPWTQSKYMIEKRKFTVDKYVLLEPNALNYARDTPSTVYRTGQVPGPSFAGGKTVVVNAGAEQLDLMVGVFDTVMLVNVLEHTRNAIQILRNTYNALKPGGMLIFNDRWWNEYTPSADLTVDTLYHPIRLNKLIFDVFLREGFEMMYEINDRESYSFNKENRHFNGTYFIGRKKSC